MKTVEHVQLTHSLVQSSGEDARTELTAQLEELLNTLSNKFAGVSSEIFAKSEWLPIVQACENLLLIFTATVDEMSRRLDNLEAALTSNKDDGNKS